VSSRQDEKEQRKIERLAREQQMAADASRRRLIRRTGGVALAVAAVGAAVVAIALGGGGPSAREAKRLFAGSQATFGQHYQALDQRGVD